MRDEKLAAAVDRRTVRAAIELASRAPSVHNSQPWRWMVGPHSVHLYADLRRWLPATDADGRDLVVSCGAALHHLRVALAAARPGRRRTTGCPTRTNPTTSPRSRCAPRRRPRPT